MPKDKSTVDFFPTVTSFTATRRKLPHWQNPGSVYFITWRGKPPQELSPAERIITLEAIRFWEHRYWQLFAAVVMPDHVHLLAQPLATAADEYTHLGKIVKSIKSYSARHINRLRQQQGSIWPPERYDRIIRDDAEFLEKWHYIRHNPLKAGLAARPEDYPWLYESAPPI